MIGRHVVHVGRERVAAIRKGGVIVAIPKESTTRPRRGRPFP